MRFYVSKYRRQSAVKLRLRSASSISNASLLAFFRCAGFGDVTSSVIEVGSLHRIQMVVRIPFAEDLKKWRLRGKCFTENSFHCVLLSSLYCLYYDNRDTSYLKTLTYQTSYRNAVASKKTYWSTVYTLASIKHHSKAVVQAGVQVVLCNISAFLSFDYHGNVCAYFKTFFCFKVKYEGGAMNTNYAYNPKMQIMFIIIAPWRLSCCAVLPLTGYEYLSHLRAVVNVAQ